MDKVQCKHWFQTMCVSGDRDTSLNMYKALRREIRGVAITKRDVRAWLKTTGIEPVTVETISENGAKVYCVYVHLPTEWDDRRNVPHILECSSYARCMFKLAFKVLAYKWDMTLSQIHDVEAWSFPQASRLTRKDWE